MEEIRELNRKVDQQQDLLNKIYIAVGGDPALGIDGVKQKVDRHEQEIKKLNESVEKLVDFKKRSQYIWGAIISIFSGGTGAAVMSGAAKTAALKIIGLFTIFVIAITYLIIHQ